MKITASLIVLSIALTSYSSVSVPAKDEPEREKAEETYLVIYRPGSAWLEGKPVFEQPLKEYGKYMLSLYIKGSMKLAGPLTDNAGGAVLLVVADQSEAKAIVAEDPAVKSGIFVYEMHPWKLQPWDEFAKKAKDATNQSLRRNADLPGAH